MKHSDEFIKRTNEAKAHIQEITCTQLKEEMAKDSPPHLIDIRENFEWETGYIPKAMHISKGILERDIVDAEPNKNQRIVLYCGGGYRSALAAESLQRMGYTSVLSLKGGLSEWKSLNFPTQV